MPRIINFSAASANYGALAEKILKVNGKKFAPDFSRAYMVSLPSPMSFVKHTLERIVARLSSHFARGLALQAFFRDAR